jgi:hypothetical protein
MQEDYADNPELFSYLDGAMEELRRLYITHYATDRAAQAAQHPLTELPSSASSSRDKSPTKVNFTSRYRRERTERDELAEYFKLPREDWEGCNPLHWWLGRRGQFPCLFGLARDLLTIPGKIRFIFLVCELIIIMVNRFCRRCRANLLWRA